MVTPGRDEPGRVWPSDLDATAGEDFPVLEQRKEATVGDSRAVGRRPSADPLRGGDVADGAVRESRVVDGRFAGARAATAMHDVRG
jgi:hypothetical protein